MLQLRPVVWMQAQRPGTASPTSKRVVCRARQCRQLAVPRVVHGGLKSVVAVAAAKKGALDGGKEMHNQPQTSGGAGGGNSGARPPLPSGSDGGNARQVWLENVIGLAAACAVVGAIGVGIGQTIRWELSGALAPLRLDAAEKNGVLKAIQDSLTDLKEAVAEGKGVGEKTREDVVQVLVGVAEVKGELDMPV